jgi:hypothetical protein
MKYAPKIGSIVCRRGSTGYYVVVGVTGFETTISAVLGDPAPITVDCAELEYPQRGAS